MKKKLKLLMFFGCMGSIIVKAQEDKFVLHTIAFYNVDNLYDTIRDAKVFDREWTPGGSRQWNKEKYEEKINNLARVISQIGIGPNKNMPTIIGLAEVENREVIEDLVKSPQLLSADYGIVHYDSPDRRGLDVALLYQKRFFVPTHSSSIPLYIYEPLDKSTTALSRRKRIYTRDQLLVTGFLDGEEFSFIINHWSSRTAREKKTNPFRVAAARLNRKIVDSLFRVNPATKTITMGDFNDGPFSESVKEVLKTKGVVQQLEAGELFNPMEQMAREGMGTIGFKDTWEVFDQIIISESLLGDDYQSFKFWKAQIFKKPFMIQTTGIYKGYPLRNSRDNGAFSDHFPVFIYVVKRGN